MNVSDNMGHRMRALVGYCQTIKCSKVTANVQKAIDTKLYWDPDRSEEQGFFSRKDRS